MFDDEKININCIILPNIIAFEVIGYLQLHLEFKKSYVAVNEYNLCLKKVGRLEVICYMQ